MEFREDIKDIYDISLVASNPEDPKITALKSIGNSFYNNIVVLFYKLIMTTNLIIIGHVVYENINHYELAMTYQIGVLILEILGKFFIIGLVKYIFEEKEDSDEVYNTYIRLKTSLIFIILIVAIPVSLLSKLIIKLLTKNIIISNGIVDEVYFKFLLFTPVIYLFEILFFLNIQYMQNQKKTNAVFSYISFFLVCHLCTCWILLYMFEIGIFGLTISYGVNSFLFYLFTNNYIQNIREFELQGFFFLIPGSQNFNMEVLNELKRESSLSFINLGEIFIIHFLFVSSLFTDKNQLIVNIIYLNVYELIFAINRGFYYTLKKYISTNVESAEKRQQYVANFSLYFMILGLSFFITLLVFNNILLDCFLFDGGNQLLKNIAKNLKIMFSLCVLLNVIRMLLNGTIRGMNVPFPVIKKIFYCTICIVLCLVLGFVYEKGVYGLWISKFILNLLFVFDNAHKAIIYLPQFFHNYI